MNDKEKTLAHEALDRLVAENQRLGLYDDKPPVKTYAGGKPNYCTPVDNVYMSEKRVHKTDKSMHEPVAIVNAGMGGIEWLTEQLPDDTPLYAAPYTKNDTSDRVLHKEWVGLSEDEFEKILETHNEAMPFAIYLNIEQALKEKNT